MPANSLPPDMHLNHCVEVKRTQERGRAKAMIACIGVKIVQIKQQPTVTLANESVEKFWFGHVLIREVKIDDRILDKEWRRKARAQCSNPRCDHVQHLLIERQGYRHSGMLLET